MSSSSLSSSQWVRVVAGVVLTLAFLTWALRGMSPASVWGAFVMAEPGWLGLSALSLLASASLRARRWGTLLGGTCNPASFGIRQSAVFIGCAGNCLLPAHAGELVRGLVLQRRGGVPLGLGLGSIFAERILDVIVLLAFLLISFIPGHGNESGSRGFDAWRFGWIGVALVVVCGGILVVVSQSERIACRVEKICVGLGFGRFSPHIANSVRALIAGLGVLRSPARAVTALVETVLIVGLSVVTFWTAMLAFGITSPGFSGALLTQSVTTLGMAIPSAPGYVGTFEAAIRFSLELYRVSPDVIIAYALTLHALIFVTLIMVGGVLAICMGLSWSDLAAPPSPIPAQPTEQKAAA